MGFVHRDLMALRWAHASPIPKDRPSKENPINVAAGVLARAMDTRRKLLEGISTASSAEAAAGTLRAHGADLATDAADFIKQTHALDADRLSSPLVPEVYRGWSDVVARLGADNLKPEFLFRASDNGDVLAAANAGEEIQAAINAGWLDIVTPDSLTAEETAPFSAPLDGWEAHALHPVPSKWGLAVWPNDLTKMNFAVPLAARLAAAERPRRLYRLRTARLFGDHTRQTEVSKALAQLLRHLGEQGHAVLLMDMDIYQTEKQDVLQRAMNEWKKLPAPPPVIGVCTELTHKMRLETKTRDLFDPVVTSNDTDAIDRWTLTERLELLSERMRFRIPWTDDPARTLLERARAFTGFAWGDFTARWVDRAVTRSWRRLLRARDSRDPFELTDADLEDILRDRPPEHLRPLRDRIANVLPRLTDAQRRELLREFNDMANPSLSRQEAQKIRLWIEEFIEIHSLPAAAPVLGGGEARDIAPALFERTQRVFARSHFGMDAVVRQVEGILTKMIQGERRAIVPESDYTCLIGPPGVGKTSILLLIGEALGRPVKIISGTKIQTEEDLKGFLRTYVNSHSGELATALRAGPPEERVRNPIVVIDEVDKIPPAIQAILLQVLDAAQNSRFEDFYLGEIDLSGVEFVLTGNDAGRIIEPLKNRMQIETLKGYTEAEKIQIAARFMLPKLLAEWGLRDALVFPRAGDALAHLIRLHDREQGVRELERLLERIVLFAAKRWVLNGRRAPVTVDTDLIDACLKTPTRPRLPLSAEDTVGIAHFPAANGFAFALETRRDTSGRVDDSPRHHDRTDGESADSSSLVPSPRLRWFDRLWRRLRHGGGAPRLPAAGDPQTAPALKEIMDLAGRLVGAKLPEEWVIAAPRSGTPPDPAAGLAAAVSLVSAETDRPVKRETVFLGALDNRGGLMPAPDLDRRLFGAIDAGAVEVVLPRAQEAEVRALAAGVVGLRGPLLIPGSDGMAELSIPLPGPSIFANDQDPAWLDFLQRARQRPEHRPGADGFLTFSGPVPALRALARESLDATAEPQTLYVLADRWDRAVPFAFREPGEAPRVRKSAHYADSVKVLIPQESGPRATTAPDVEERPNGEAAADRTVLFMNDNYRRRMIAEPATRVADDLFEAVVENYDPAKVASAEAVLRSALVHNPAVAARFFIRMIDVWITGDKMPPAQRRAIMEIFGTLSPDTVGSMLLASAQFGADMLLLRISASALGLQKALAAPGNKTAALGALTNLRVAFHKEGGDGDLPHPIDDLARRLNAWDPARSPAAPADLAQWADSVARRALLFVNDIEQAQRAPLVGNEPAAREDLKIRFPDYANQPLHELFELNHRGVDDLTETLGVYTAGRLLEDMEDLGFVTEHRPLAPLTSPEDDLLDPVLRGAGHAVADQAATSALRHTVLLSCPDPLRAAFPDYLARYLWRDGLPRRVLRLNTLNLQMPNTEFADDTAFAWRRMQRVIQSAARQGNCLLVIDLDEFQKNVPAARHAIDLGRILAVANDSAKPLPLVFIGSEAAHLRFQESVTAYGDQVVAVSLADVSPGAVLRAQVGQLERARERPILAAGVLPRIVQQIHDRALGLRGAQRLIDRLSALPAPADLDTFQRERDKMDAEDQRGSKDLSIEQRFERESYRLPPAVRAQAEKFLGLWVASSGDEAAKLEHRLRLILDFPYPRVPSAEQKARDAQNLLGDLPDTLRRLRNTLDAEFFGMDEVKDRIEDFVTRTLLSRAAGSPPRGKGLLLVGPPGTAKTTIVLAISEALGIPMTVVPCGAVKDAQYFVGFDSGFLGSKIGKLCEAAIRMGVPNGIYLLDEIEKMRPNESGQHPGDVFLQILDPKQNTRVREKFLGVDTDYSQNLFIATANGLDGIPAPLLDRFDVVALTGYNKSAKVAIGHKLVRRLIQKWRIEEDVRTPDLPGVIAVAVEKTHRREKGVRQLGKALNAVFKAALTEKFKSGLDTPIEVTPDFARRALRAAPVETTEDRPVWAVGRVQGLAVMSGEGEEGQVLEIEADLLPAPHAESPLRVVAAGRAQALMDFSQQTALPAALGWLERHGGPTVNSFQGKLIALLVLPWHIPKDGDSAGTAFALAMLSALTGRPLRQDFAITGAISRGGKIQLVGGIADKVTKAQQVAKTIFLPRENENDLLSHLLKSPDQIHFVESRRPGGDWERVLYVMPRAFTNAGLPASAVDRFVRDAKDAGLAAVYDPAMKSNEWIKIAGIPGDIESFFQSHRGVLETPPLHVLADRLEDVVERVLGDASDTPPDPPSSPSSGGSGSSSGSAGAASAAGLTPGIDPDSARIPVQAAVKGALAIASVFFTPWQHVKSAAGLIQGPKTGADHNQRVRETLALLNPLVKTARPEWAESIKTHLARWKPNESNPSETMDTIKGELEAAIFRLSQREQQANALAAITMLGAKPEARPRPDSSAIPVLTLDWNSVLSGEGKGLLRVAETFLAESPRARVVLAGSPLQKSAMESALIAGPLGSRASRVLILNTLPASGSVNTEEVKEWIRERLGASGLLGEGGLRFRLGATPDQAQRWTGLLHSLLVFSREVVVPAAVWNQMKPHLQGDPGVDNPDGSHTLPAREYSLADLLKSITEDVVIQTQA
jgi:ATP-dependent Lon protease